MAGATLATEPKAAAPGVAAPPTHAQRAQRRLVALVVLALLAGFALRAHALINKGYFWNDEIVSLMTVAGEWGHFRVVRDQGAAPFQKWATVADWQRFTAAAEQCGGACIVQEVTYYDIHPPLYFWLLDGWLAQVGVQRWSGVLLNLGLELLILATVATVGRLYWGTWRSGGVAGAIWWLTPVAVRTSTHMRPYVLLTLLAALFVLAHYRLCYGTSRGGRRVAWGAAAGAIAVLGLATQYLFLFLIITGALVACLAVAQPRGRGRTQGRRLVLAGGLALAVLALTVAVIALMHPNFESVLAFLSLSAARARQAGVLRLGKMVFYNALLYIPLLAAALTVVMTGGLRPALTGRTRPSFSLALVLWASVPVLATDAIYLAGISPRQAISSPYLTMVTPCVALAAAALLIRARAPARAAQLLLIVLLVGAGMMVHPRVRDYGPMGDLAALRLEAAEVIVIENRPRRLGVFNLLPYLDSATPIYVADASALAAAGATWRTPLAAQGGLYIAIRHTDDPPAPPPAGLASYPAGTLTVNWQERADLFRVEPR